MQAQQFATQPAAVNRQKYRDEGATNIMHDRRVVRGNTYAALVIPEDDSAELNKQREAQRRRLKKANYTRHRPGTPEPVPGRHHMDVQTDTYLEELTERLAEFEAETQTDFLLDRPTTPTTPLYIPAKSGVDRATQIEEGELFDFDTEVEAILEVLVGKTLEKSMMEVLEEEEVEAMRRHQEYFQQLREQELIEVQRMEASERRKQEEISRRKEQASARKQLDDAVLRKILSRAISRNYLSGLGARCFEELHDAGIFRDNYLIGVEGSFMPWLLENVKSSMDNMNKNERIVNQAIREAIGEKNSTHQKVLAYYEDQIDELESAEQRVRDEKNEEKRLKMMEERRIRDEQERLMRGEDIDWTTTRTVADYADGVLTLDDESTDVQVPDEFIEELSARVAANAEGDEKIPIEIRVNMTKRLLVEILAAPEPVAQDEEAGQDEDA